MRGFTAALRAGSIPVVDALPVLRRLTEAFKDEAGRVPPAAAPAALGRWTAADLVAHLGGVHRWAAASTRGMTRVERQNVPAITVRPVDYYAESRQVLLDTLTEIDPDQPCYTFAGDRTVRFWHRRQLHETLVHLWDLRSAADPLAPVPTEAAPEVCADGVDELFGVFVARADRQARPRLPGSLGLSATDIGRRWLLVQDGSDWRLLRDAAEPVDTEVRAAAGDLLLLVWNRIGPELGRFTVTGDPAPLDTFLQAKVRP